MLNGLILHIIAKVAFVICTYGVHLFLGKSLTPLQYGEVGVVISIITFNYNFLSNGIRQAESKLLATSLYDERKLVKKGILWQALVAAVLTAVNYLFADNIAVLLNAPSMAEYIRLTSFLIPVTAGYFVFVGIINGKRKFVVEATIVTIYPILRLTVIPYVLYGSNKTAGVVYGFLTSAAVAFILSGMYLVKNRSQFVARDSECNNSIFAHQAVDFLVFFTCITIILNADMLFSNALVDDHRYIGYYTGAVNIAKVSYYLLTAIYLVVLPTITAFVNKKKIEEARNVIIALINMIGLFIAPIMVILMSSSGCILATFYKPEYSEIAFTASVLIASQFLIGLFVVGNMCIIAASNKEFSTRLAVAITIADCILCYFCISKWGIFGAAFATFLSGAVGVLLTFQKLGQIYGKLNDSFSIIIIIENIVLAISVFLLFSNVGHFITNLFVLGIAYFLLYVVFLALNLVINRSAIQSMIKVFLKKQ